VRTDLKRAAAVMRILPGGRILEVGCGAGSLLACLDPDRYEVVGVESSAPLAAEARRRLAESGVRGAIVEGCITEAKLSSEGFDLVAMFGTLDNCPSPRTTFMKASELLRGGGYAVIETPSLSSLTARLYGMRWEPLRDPATEYFFTAASLERLATLCGLTSGAAWLTLLGGWPPPGTLLYVARKSGPPVKLADLADLAPEVRKMTPMGATH
jgi:2-polyprenyl-3-methyl-5-hydroxy-6-metoxy-1,4-benzoquinol methylase